MSKLRPVEVLSILLALLFVAAGGMKLSGAAEPVEEFRALGYSDEFRLFIGAAEAAGAVGLLIPSLAALAASGLAIIIVGATWTHISHGQLGETAFTAILCGLLVWIARVRWRGRA